MADELLPLSRLESSAERAARVLLGCLLCRRLEDGTVLRGRIVETEGYAGAEDVASHSFGGRRTGRNESMYARAGTAYVYFTYGMHWCMNVACSIEDDPQAVLLRAIEPVEGADRMEILRRSNPRAARRLAEIKIGAGPARLCAAMGLDRSWDGVDLLARSERGEDLWLEHGDRPSRTLVGPRIGIDRVGEPWLSAPLRFGVEGSPSLSKPFPTVGEERAARDSAS